MTGSFVSRNFRCCCRRLCVCAFSSLAILFLFIYLFLVLYSRIPFLQKQQTPTRTTDACLCRFMCVCVLALQTSREQIEFHVSRRSKDRKKNVKKRKHFAHTHSLNDSNQQMKQQQQPLSQAHREVIHEHRVYGECDFRDFV